MEQFPTRRRRVPPSEDPFEETLEEQDEAIQEDAVRFMVQVLNATVYSSGEDYERSLHDFFPQLEALGHLIGARSLDEVSFFLRRQCRPL